MTCPATEAERHLAAVLREACGYDEKRVVLPKFVPVFEDAVRWLGERGRCEVLVDDFTGAVVAGRWLPGQAPWETE